MYHMKYSEKNAEVSNILDLNVIWLVRIILNIKSFLGRTDLHKMVRGGDEVEGEGGWRVSLEIFGESGLKILIKWR